MMMKKTPIKKHLPMGISLLRLFYAVNAFLMFFTSLLFFDYLDIVIFGNTMPAIPAALVRLALAGLPLYLVFGFSALKKESYPLALVYHFFFLINAASIILYALNKNLRIRPLLEIITKPEYRTSKISDFFGASFHIYIIQILSIAIGFAIITYLYKKRDLFKN